MSDNENYPTISRVLKELDGLHFGQAIYVLKECQSRLMNAHVADLSTPRALAVISELDSFESDDASKDVPEIPAWVTEFEDNLRLYSQGKAEEPTYTQIQLYLWAIEKSQPNREPYVPPVLPHDIQKILDQRRSRLHQVFEK